MAPLQEQDGTQFCSCTIFHNIVAAQILLQFGGFRVTCSTLRITFFFFFFDSLCSRCWLSHWVCFVCEWAEYNPNSILCWCQLSVFLSSWLHAVYSQHIKNGRGVDPVMHAASSFRNVPLLAPYVHPGGGRRREEEKKGTKETSKSHSAAWSWQANCKAAQGRISAIIVQEGRIIL